MVKKPNLVNYQYALKKRSPRQMNSSFYEQRGGGADLNQLAPFNGTTDSKGFKMARNESEDGIPRESLYNKYDEDGESNIVEEVKREKLVDRMITPTASRLSQHPSSSRLYQVGPPQQMQ